MDEVAAYAFFPTSCHLNTDSCHCINCFYLFLFMRWGLCRLRCFYAFASYFTQLSLRCFACFCSNLFFFDHFIQRIHSFLLDGPLSDLKLHSLTRCPSWFDTI